MFKNVDKEMKIKEIVKFEWKNQQSNRVQDFIDRQYK